jgi:SAM-dependent methyltransferase
VTMGQSENDRFEAEQYWSNRLEETDSLEGVGYLGMGEQWNRWMYAVRRRVFSRVVRQALDLSSARVLDIGSGTGFYVALWKELGAREVTGSDLTLVAVERLRARFPSASAHQLDLTGSLPADLGQFDAISAMDVLFHIVDDDGYARAIENLARLLVPGGVVVLTENLVHGGTERGEHQTSRSFDEVLGLLSRWGLEVEQRRPAFVLMNTPIDSANVVLRHAWTGVNLLVRGGPRRAWATGAALYPLELGLTRIVREGPSTEIVACRKSAAAR